MHLWLVYNRNLAHTFCLLTDVTNGESGFLASLIREQITVIFVYIEIFLMLAVLDTV